MEGEVLDAPSFATGLCPCPPGWGAKDKPSDCAGAMNQKRSLHWKLNVPLESGRTEAGILDVLYRGVMADGE